MSKQKLVVNLLELIQISVMTKIMKLVQYKHLSVNLKQTIKKIKQKIKRTRRQNRKIGRSNHPIK